VPISPTRRIALASESLAGAASVARSTNRRTDSSNQQFRGIDGLRVREAENNNNKTVLRGGFSA